MRHRIAGKQLNRTSGHRQALRRNLAASLFEHGTIMTTREKAKFVRPFAEKLITIARKNTLHARRRVIALLQDRDICKVEHDEPTKETTVVNKLFSEIAPRYVDRPGGYTRVVKLPIRRVGDNGQQVLLQLVEESMADKPKRRRKKPASTAAKPAAEQAPAVQDAAPAAEQAAEMAEEPQSSHEDAPSEDQPAQEKKQD